MSYQPPDLIDFSPKHHILLQDEDGTLRPMDEPFFQAKQVAPETWQVLSDGDYSWLLAGDEEAMVIDSGYGTGNLRAYCQTLTDKPVRWIANTHDHFDHTANNAYFDLAYMSEKTRPLATLPYPSFEGIEFPRDYPVEVVQDGDLLPLKGRELLVLMIGDHTEGGTAYLDRKQRLLFSGDELMGFGGKTLNGSVERWKNHLEKLSRYRGDFDRLCTGGGMVDASLVDAQLANVQYILEGHEGKPAQLSPFPHFDSQAEDGRPVWKRRAPHPGDGPKEWDKDIEFQRVMEHAGCRITYDIRRIFEE